MNSNILTQERLKELFYYNKQFGIFVRIISRGTEKKCTIAGSLSQYGYINIHIDGTQYKAHRLAFLYVNGKFPPHEVDHINGIRNDNSFYNLRQVTIAENAKNQKLDPRNTSGIMGVRWYKNRGKWMAFIKFENKLRYLGSFDDKFEAICARKSAELKYNFHPNHGRRI